MGLPGVSLILGIGAVVRPAGPACISVVRGITSVIADDGIYVSGPFTEPKDIPETIMQASGASSKVLSLLKDVKGSLIVPKEYPPEIDVSGQEPRIGIFVCHCGY